MPGNFHLPAKPYGARYEHSPKCGYFEALMSGLAGRIAANSVKGSKDQLPWLAS